MEDQIITSIDGRTKLLKKKDELIEELKTLEEEEDIEKEVALEERDQTTASPSNKKKEAQEKMDENQEYYEKALNRLRNYA